MRSLVTGAAGFVGSHLVERLLAEGHEVVGIDSFDSFYDPAVKWANLAAAAADGRFELVRGDLCDPAVDLTGHLAGVDTVFHLAGRPGVPTSWGGGCAGAERSNVLATRCLLAAAVAARPRPLRIVVASSSSVYGRAERFPVREDDALRPVSPYGRTKLEAERLCGAAVREHRLDMVVLRYFSLFGPRQRPDMAFSRFLAAAERGRRLPVHGTGDQVRDFTYVGDAVAATVLAARRGRTGRAYNVAGGCPASLREVVATLEGLIGRRLPADHGPPVPGDPQRTHADTTRAARELGYRPQVHLREGLAAQVGAAAALAA